MSDPPSDSPLAINQRGSPLLQLPWEIREEIYSYIVIRDGTTYHTSRRFLGHTPSACFTITPILPSHITNYNNPFRTRPLPGSNRTRRKNRPIVIPEKDSLGTLPLVLKLFLTCRQTYAEARDVLFRHHTFSFDSPKVFMSWSGHPIGKFITSAQVVLEIDIGDEYSWPTCWVRGWKTPRYKEIPLWSRRRFPSLRNLKVLSRGDLCLCSKLHSSGAEHAQDWYMHVMSLRSWVENEVGKPEDLGVSLTYAFYFRACCHLRDGWRASDRDLCQWEWDGRGETFERGVERMFEKQLVKFSGKVARDAERESLRIIRKVMELGRLEEEWELERARVAQE